MGYEIEKGVPMPGHGHGRRKYPFGDMEVGDSFEFDAANQRRIASASSWYGARNAKKFSIRVTNGTGRCWRVE